MNKEEKTTPNIILAVFKIYRENDISWKFFKIDYIQLVRSGNQQKKYEFCILKKEYYQCNHVQQPTFVLVIGLSFFLSLFPPLFCCLEKDLDTINMGAQNCSLYGGIEMSRLILRMKHPTQNQLAMGGEAQDLICSDEGFKCLLWDFFILNNCNNTCLEYVYLQVGQRITSL